ncbi:hypothetical protein VUR80DRAFT_855 [Thermomyces stellatus]
MLEMRGGGPGQPKVEQRFGAGSGVEAVMLVSVGEARPRRKVHAPSECKERRLETKGAGLCAIRDFLHGESVEYFDPARRLCAGLQTRRPKAQLRRPPGSWLPCKGLKSSVHSKRGQVLPPPPPPPSRAPRPLTCGETHWPVSLAPSSLYSGNW